MKKTTTGAGPQTSKIPISEPRAQDANGKTAAPLKWTVTIDITVEPADGPISEALTEYVGGTIAAAVKLIGFVTELSKRKQP